MRRVLLGIMVGIGLAGCGDAGGGGGGSSYGGIAGNIQKGPFILGSSITIQELDADLVPTGSNFNVQTTNDLGAFGLPTGIGSQFVEIIAQGFYFDEVNNRLSSANLTLRSVSDLNGLSSIVVNVLTTLAKQRITFLVNGGAEFAAAVLQTQTEVLSAFNIQDSIAENLDQMDISGTGTGSAILLATSAILQQMANNRSEGGNDTAELSSALSTMSTDIESDGVLDSARTRSDLLSASSTLDLIAVRSNLEARYADLGQSINAPPFEDFVDSDADGLLNGKDPDDDNDGIPDADDTSPVSADFWFDRAPMPTARSNLASAAFNGKIYVFGGSADGLRLDANEEYDPARDTWKSKTAMPSARNSHAAVAVNSKIYIFGGRNNSGSTELAVYEYDPASGMWTNCDPNPSCAPMTLTPSHGVAGLDSPPAAEVNGVIYMFGGHQIPAKMTQAYDIAANSWSQKADMLTARHSGPTASAVGGLIYVIGGNPDTQLVEVYDPSSNKWSTRTSKPNGVVHSQASVINGKIFVLGEGNEVEVYDPVTDSWQTRTPRTQQPAIVRFAATPDIGRLYVFGGLLGGSDPAVDTVIMYDPTFDN